MNANPSMNLLDALHDPERYTTVEAVPVFVQHVRHEPVFDDDGEPELDENGEPVLEVAADVDEDELRLIAQTMNERLERTGVPARISVGHVKLKRPGVPDPSEKDQPEIWGWATGATVGPWGPEGKPHLLVDWHIRNDRFHESLTYPYRSAEYYPSTHEITGIALLRRDPELDMGVLTYARTDTPEAGMADEFDDDEYLDDETDQPDLYADDFDDEMGEGVPDEDEYSPEEVEQYARLHRYNAKRAEEMLAEMAEDDEDRPQMEQLARCYGRLAYGAGEPAGGNTYVPGTDDVPMEPVGGEVAEEPAHYSRTRQPRQPERQPQKPKKPQVVRAGREQQQYERRLALLEQEQRETRREREMLAYERQLTALQQAGCEFDMEAELADAAEMTPKQRERQLEKIQMHYGRDITAGPMVGVGSGRLSETRGETRMTAAQRRAALEYQGRTNCTWEQAMAHAQKTA